MIDLTYRSTKKELLDADDVPFADIKKNMQELNTINTLLGGHKITIRGFKKLLGNRNTISVCEIGCGGGDNLHAIEAYCKRHGIICSFTGIDIKKECIDFAKEQYPEMNCNWVCSDYQTAVFTEEPDIIFSSLFCHHFNEQQLQVMLQWMKHNSGSGFFINDLHRNIIAYYSIKWLTSIFSGSYLVKNDAPLSVARGFLKQEWENIISNSGLQKATIQWQWAFRHLISYKHD